MSKLFIIGLLLAMTPVIALAAPPAVPARILSVGPGKALSLPSQAAAVAQDGDIVEIAPGTYPGDAAIWRANGLTIRGVGGRAALNAQGHIAEGKAIWVIKGDDTRVENIEFTGAANPDHNGAGIRQEGRGLIVRNCVFHDNEDGILAGPRPGSDILVENSEFRHNGQGDGYSHNLYIGHIRNFILRGCWSHDAHAGHDVKSRAGVNTIVANRISDDADSDTSYLLDFPNGGDCRVIGNLFERAKNAPNGTLINFAEEGAENSRQALFLINNTLVNARPGAFYVRVAHASSVQAVNNLFTGPGVLLAGAGIDMTANQVVGPGAFRDAKAGDFHPAAVGGGRNPGKDGDFDLPPRLEYSAPTGFRPRIARTPLDMGAFAFSDSKH